jgi:hypothetical protein
MNNIQIASLAFKLAGIFSIIQAIPLLREISEVLALKNSPIFETTNGQAYPSNFIFIGIIASISLLILFGLILLCFSDTFSIKMFGKDNSPPTPESEITAKNIQTMAFSIVGVILVVVAIPKIVQVGANIQALVNAGDGAPTRNISAGTWAYSIGMTVQMLVGILLFVGSKGLSSLWYFLQKSRPMSKMNMEKT